MTPKPKLEHTESSIFVVFVESAGEEYLKQRWHPLKKK